MAYVCSCPNASHSVPIYSSMQSKLVPDDSACATDLDHRSEWFEKLCLMGPKYGYHPEPNKTVSIVDKAYDSEAHAKFDHLGVKVVRGHRFLGGFYWRP